MTKILQKRILLAILLSLITAPLWAQLWADDVPTVELKDNSLLNELPYGKPFKVKVNLDQDSATLVQLTINEIPLAKQSLFRRPYDIKQILDTQKSAKQLNETFSAIRSQMYLLEKLNILSERNKYLPDSSYSFMKICLNIENQICVQLLKDFHYFENEIMNLIIQLRVKSLGV